MVLRKQLNKSDLQQTSTPLMKELLEALPKLNVPLTNMLAIVEGYCLASEIECQQKFPEDFEPIKFGNQCLVELKEAKEVEEEKSSWPPKAQGVANRLSRYSETQIKIILTAWNSEANQWEEKDKQAHVSIFWELESKKLISERSIYCHSLRQLIAYYLPLSGLREIDPLYKRYKLKKVREYVLSSIEDAKDALIHALRIKFAVADGRHADAMELIRKSSANLNLQGADISDIYHYYFQGIDLSKSCLENAIISRGFFLTQANDFSLPVSLKGANLKNVRVSDDRWVIENSQIFIEIFSQAERGLDIRFRDDDGTLLHHMAGYNNRFNEIQSLLQYGADCALPDRDGNLPCSIAMVELSGLINVDSLIIKKILFFFEYLKFRDAHTYAQLIVSLNENELEQQAQLCRKYRNQMLFSVGLIFLTAFLGAGLLLFNFLPAAISPIALIADPTSMLFKFLTVTLSGLGGIVSVFGLLGCVFRVPYQLYSFFTNYYQITQSIELQGLANRPGPQQQDYQFHLLFKKKYQSHKVSALYSVDAKDYFTPPEKSLFNSLNNREQLQRQKQLNQQLAKKEKLYAAGLLIVGLVFLGIAVIAGFMSFSAPMLIAIDPIKVQSFLGIVGTILSMPISSLPFMYYFMPTIGFFYTGITRLIESSRAEKAIDQMIQQKIDVLPVQEPAPTSTPTMQLILVNAPKPALELVAEHKSQPASDLNLAPVVYDSEQIVEAEDIPSKQCRAGC